MTNQNHTPQGNSKPSPEGRIELKICNLPYADSCRLAKKKGRQTLVIIGCFASTELNLSFEPMKNKTITASAFT